MPSTINGIGTWYYGKTDIHRLKGVCEFCGNMGELTSYDTTLYFVVVFIPVIPLSRYRVLEECPVCQKHRVIKSKEWKLLKETNSQAVLEKLDKNPRDRDAILEGMEMVIGFQEKSLLERLIPLTQPFHDDAEVQAKLAACFNYFSMREEATEAYKRSLLAEDTPATRENLAFNLLRAGEPEEAYPLTRHIIEEKIKEKLYLPFLLIDTYQSQGKHQPALDLLDELEAAFPEIAEDKEVKKLRAQSQKYLSSGKPVKRATLVDTSRGGVQQGSNFSKWVPLLIVLALAGGYFGRTFYLGENCPVYLLNGATKPYEVKVQEKKYLLQPGSPQLIHVPEGELLVESTTPELEIPAVKCRVETNFWSRFFSRPVFVINPDENAMLMQEKATYAKNPPINKPANPPPVVLDATSFHQVDEPDYLFSAFPDSISVKGSGTITKTRLASHAWQTSTQMLNYLEDHLKDGNQLRSRVKRMLMINPDDYILLAWLQRHMSSDEQLNLLQTKLGQQPLLVDWHRAYQELCFKLKPPRDVRGEYEKRLAQATPSDKANATYLLGRLTNDPEGFAMIREAATMNTPSFYAMYAVGNRALLAGDFATAWQWAEKLQAANRQHQNTVKLTKDVLMAQKKYSELEQWSFSPMHAEEGRGEIMLERYRSAVMQNDKEAANEAKLRILVEVRREAPDKAAILESILQSLEYIIQGNVQGYLRIAKQEPASNDPFITAVLKKDLSEAEQKVKREVENDNSFLLHTSLLYLLAKKKNDQKLADQCWEDIVRDIRTTSRTAKPLVDMLEGKAPFQFEIAQQAYFSPEEKRAVLLVLADRYPAQAVQLKELARKLNFQRDIYSMAINELMK